MIIAALVIRQQKSINTIKLQMERIYKLYGEGYGTNNMLHGCEQKVYIILSKMEY